MQQNEPARLGGGVILASDVANLMATVRRRVFLKPGDGANGGGHEGDKREQASAALVVSTAAVVPGNVGLKRENWKSYALAEPFRLCCRRLRVI